jgi:LPS O-antigen subunit length determinant protein (WzzB/FepE family)
MTDEQKDARIKQLQEALSICNQLLTQTLERVKQAEDRWAKVAETLLQRVKDHD